MAKIPDAEIPRIRLLSLRMLGLVCAIWSIVSLMDGLRAITWYRSTQRTFSYGNIVAYAIGETLMWTAITLCVLWLLDRWPENKRALSILFATALLIAGALLIIVMTSTLFSLSGVSKKGVPALLLTSLPRNFHGSMFQIVIVLGAALILRERFAAEQTRLRESKLETQLVQAQLNSVAAKLQPHFLFNTLHAITVVLHKDPRMAERMIAGLGDLLRLSLAHQKKEFGSLDDELYFVERYLFLQHVRLGNRLEVEIDADTHARKSMFPRFILQPLVENAVKHGIDVGDAPGTVSICAMTSDDRLIVTVRNSVPPGARWSSEGVGLSCVRQRLELLFGTDHRLEFDRAENIVTAIITLPSSPAESDSETVDESLEPVAVRGAQS